MPQPKDKDRLNEHKNKTPIYVVYPTWSLIANSDSLTVAQLTSVPTVNKSQFFLSKITAPNTFHFLTSAFYPVMRRWGKL